MEEQRKSESDMSREERSEAGDEIVFSQKEFGQKLRKYFWQHGPDKVHKGLAKIGEKMPCRALPESLRSGLGFLVPQIHFEEIADQKRLYESDLEMESEISRFVGK